MAILQESGRNLIGEYPRIPAFRHVLIKTIEIREAPTEHNTVWPATRAAVETLVAPLALGRDPDPQVIEKYRV